MLKHEDLVLLSLISGYLWVENFSEIQEYASKKYGRPLFTHEFANPSVYEELRTACRDDILDLATRMEKMIGDSSSPNSRILALNPNTYQKVVRSIFNIKYSSNDEMLRHAVLSIASEAGEVTDIFQKEYQGHPVEEEHLVKELGDVIACVAEACTAIGWDLEDVMSLNITKLQNRYPNGFEAERSIHRKEEDI